MSTQGSHALFLGSSFEWADLLAYTVGIGLVLLAERAKLAYFPARKDAAKAK